MWPSSMSWAAGAAASPSATAVIAAAALRAHAEVAVGGRGSS